MATEVFHAPTQAQLDAINAGSNTPVTVADRNTANLTTTNASISGIAGIPDNAPLSSLPTFQTMSKSQSVQIDSNQITIGQQSDGIAAASTNSVAANQTNTDNMNAQLGVGNTTPAFPTDAATPVNPGSLQSQNDVFANGFSTVSLGANNIPQTNQPDFNADQWDRVKLRYRTGHPMASYPGALTPLAATTGLVWLYKPAVQVQMNVDYETMSLTHSIQEIHAFSSNRAASISVSGQFVSQNIDEAMYALAAIHFMRSVAKMAFGTEVPGATNATPIGSPPPVLLLSGYGPLMLNDIPVIVSNVSFDFPADVDYIEIPSSAMGTGGTKIPVSFNLTANLIVQQAPQDMRSFNVDTYTKTGIRGWWLGMPFIYALPHMIHTISSLF